MEIMQEIIATIRSGDGVLPAGVAVIGIVKMIWSIGGGCGVYWTGVGLWLIGWHLLSKLINTN